MRCVSSRKIEVPSGKSKSLIKEFARRMADDHGKANEKLVPLARAAEVPVRKDFDLDQKTAQLLEWEIGSGTLPAGASRQ